MVCFRYGFTIFEVVGESFLSRYIYLMSMHLKHLGAFGRVWECLGRRGNVWDRLEKTESVWENLGSFYERL